MGNIVLLDDLTINKIAAGEVIERPASVVKEMVENSIDAGAKNITVEIQKGGISLIRIKDDGSGIAEDDMEIAFERHATSKIRSADDLENVRSMGFRGEALASIAAISKVEMISKRVDSEVGHKIVVEGGKVLEKSEAGCNTGTTITVQNLFFNTPVRYKFLKKNYTEAGYIEDAITRIALVNKNVAIKLISDGKTIVQTNGSGDLKNVIYSIYGKDIATETIEVNYEYEDMKVTGVIGKPVIARSNRSNQIFFVNGRYVKDKSLTAAAEQAYKGIIPVARYGFLVLNLEIDPKKVDVNVHPAKLEVRFENENSVFKAIYHGIKAGLTESELSQAIKKEENTPFGKTISSISDNENFVDIPNVEERKGLSGIFQKIMKEPEELKTEENRNSLEEIYEFRKGLAEIGVNPISSASAFDIINIQKNNEDTTSLDDANYIKRKDFKSDNNSNFNNIEEKNNDNFANININKYSEFAHKLESNLINENLKNNDDLISKEKIDKSEDINKEDIDILSINDNEISKKVNFGNTSISSDTKELDVTVVNDMIKEKTLEVLSIKNDNMQETQAIPKIEIDKKKDDLNKQDTQILDIDLSSKGMKNLENKEDKNVSSDETIIINNNHNDKIYSNKEENIKEDFKANPTSNVDNFSAIAEKLVEAKLVSENTQMIDTSKVREAMKQSNNKEDDNIESEMKFDEMYKKTFGVDPNGVRKEKELEILGKEKTNATTEMSYIDGNESVFEDLEDEIPEIKYRLLGIAFDSYIIIEIKNEMYIVDISVAEERIIYEKIKYNYYNEEKDEQFLLLPDVITITNKQMVVARENIYMFSKAGFSFEEFGDNTIKLISVPGICEKLNTKQLFIDILDEIDKVAVIEVEEKEEKFISTIASRVAQKTKLKLDEEEADNLLKDLFSLPDPFSCPNGKNIAMKMTKYDLERKFSRK